jgi:hypothetical protein
MKQYLGVGISVGVLAARSTFNGALAAQERARQSDCMSSRFLDSGGYARGSPDTLTFAV